MKLYQLKPGELFRFAKMPECIYRFLRIDGIYARHVALSNEEAVNWVPEWEEVELIDE